MARQSRNLATAEERLADTIRDAVMRQMFPDVDW